MKDAEEMTRDPIQGLVDKPDDFSFEDLLDPYRESGTQVQPVRRTWGTLATWLMDKLQFSPEITGAGIFLVCLELKNGLKFDGDGTYGSSGRQLCQHLRQTCLVIRQKRAEEQIFGIIGRKFYSQIEGYVAEEIKKSTRPFWKRIF